MKRIRVQVLDDNDEVEPGKGIKHTLTSMITYFIDQPEALVRFQAWLVGHEGAGLAALLTKDALAMFGAAMLMPEPGEEASALADLRKAAEYKSDETGIPADQLFEMGRKILGLGSTPTLADLPEGEVSDDDIAKWLRQQ